MSFASANGVRLVSASIGLPLFGCWMADVELELPGALAGPISLVVGNLTLLGAVYRQGGFGGVQRARLVGGYGGWRADVSAASYSNPTGVRMSTALLDLAASCGEQIVPPTPDTMIGQHFVRENAPASRILRQLVGLGWYVDTKGVTQVGARPATSITSPFTVETFDTAKGEAVIATEDYAAWMPGASFAGPTASGVVSFARIGFGNEGRLRLAVLVSP
jgi:hypothetical protein